MGSSSQTFERVWCLGCWWRWKGVGNVIGDFVCLFVFGKFLKDKQRWIHVSFFFFDIGWLLCHMTNEYGTEEITWPWISEAYLEWCVKARSTANFVEQGTRYDGTKPWRVPCGGSPLAGCMTLRARNFGLKPSNPTRGSCVSKVLIPTLGLDVHSVAHYISTKVWQISCLWCVLHNVSVSYNSQVQSWIVHCIKDLSVNFCLNVSKLFFEGFEIWVWLGKNLEKCLLKMLTFSVSRPSYEFTL